MARFPRRVVSYLSIAIAVITVAVCIALAAIRLAGPRSSKPGDLPADQEEAELIETAKRFAGLRPSRRTYRAQDYFADPKAAELAEAARDGDCQRIDAMIAQGVNVNARGKDGWTLLMYSMSGGNTRGFQRLLERGADPNLHTDTGDSAVHFAAHRLTPDFLVIVLAHGGDPNLPFKPKRPLKTFSPTPIYDAISSRNPENARILIKAGADVNARTSCGWTPLMIAATIHSFDVMLVLLEAVADLRAKDENGYPVSEYICPAYDSIDPMSPVAAARRRCIDFMEKRGVDLAKEKLKNAEIARQIQRRPERHAPAVPTKDGAPSSTAN